MASKEEQPVIALEKLISKARGCDKGRLRKTLQRSRKSPLSGTDTENFRSVAEASILERNRRKRNPPSVAYPLELPIVSRKDEIVEAIRKNQVVILSGETGSGKTTQLPKMCIEAGRGVDGLIGCTQPRRIAALTVASRIAEELANEILVGSKIRFHDSSAPGNWIRIMTDGILLAEAQGHPALNAYDTLIIDEAHERSLNIDVLLGLLRRLIDRRRNLKLIITSATLDTEKFSRHFDNAPIIEVSGRTYPVDIRYEEPGEEERSLSLAERTAMHIGALVRESSKGDILAFLPTEQDIRDTMDLVGKSFADRLNIFPLFARLPASEQKKAFQSGGRRKLVVATNVAETSLTIPGIRYVVDSGLARISRYNPGTGTHGLPVDPISRASADQRAGRCGRVQDGICIRMYSREDYESRGEYTPPEIRRTNLAEVVLRLIDQGIRDIESFPFVDPPDSAGIRDGLRTLREIGALSVQSDQGSKGRNGKSRALSSDGRIMARLPLDPRLARVLIQADREACLGDVLPVAAALSLPDPRERPPEKVGSADRAHKEFIDENSDFIGWLNIWDAFRSYGRKGSYSGKLKKFCQENYLSFRRMKEWMDVHRQLALVMEENGYRPKRLDSEPSVDPKGNFSGRYTAIHRALLSGFLSHIARHEEKGRYEATRNRTAMIHPGSALHRSGVSWIVAAEIVRTSRLYARSVAAIDPDWLIDLGADLATRNWRNPTWHRKEGAVMAVEQMRLYGFLISNDKLIPYASVKPMESREIFIQSALIDGDISDTSPYRFLKSNNRLLKRLSAMEEKLRRRDLIAGEEALISFYAAHLHPSVVDLGTLNASLKADGDSSLYLEEEDLLTALPDGDALNTFPDAVAIAGEKWKVSYVFDPDSNRDGATVKIPSGRISELRADQVDWLIPGMLEEKVEALIRGLPKNLRKKLIPVPQTAAMAVEGMERENTDLVHALSAWIYRERGINIPPDTWESGELPDYLKVRFSVLDDSGREAATGRNPGALQIMGNSPSEKGRSAVYRKKHRITGLQSWPGGDIPESVDLEGGALLWPALSKEEGSVSLDFFNDRNEAESRHREAQVWLARTHWARELRDFARSMPLSGEARVQSAYTGGAEFIEESLWTRILDDVFGKPLVRTEIAWSELLSRGGGGLHGLAEDYFSKISDVLIAYGKIRRSLGSLAERSHRREFVQERLREAEELISGDFISSLDPSAWASMPRWLEGILSRARKGAADPAKDEKARIVWEPVYLRLETIRENLSPLASEKKRAAIEDASLAIRELYIVLFAAGEVRARGKVSESRVNKQLDDIERLL